MVESSDLFMIGGGRLNFFIDRSDVVSLRVNWVSLKVTAHSYFWREVSLLVTLEITFVHIVFAKTSSVFPIPCDVVPFPFGTTSCVLFVRFVEWLFKSNIEIYPVQRRYQLDKIFCNFLQLQRHIHLLHLLVK